jgi:hypothetical protein
MLLLLLLPILSPILLQITLTGFSSQLGSLSDFFTFLTIYLHLRRLLG